MIKQQTNYNYRKAKIEDCPKLEELIILSSKSINNNYYSEEVVEAALGNIWTVDQQLILDETYWLIENDKNEIIGCGGWSKRKLLFGNNKTMNSNNEELNPTSDSAKIRAFFIHPKYTRQGLGKELLNICENEAKSNGFKSLDLVATLSGENLYKVCGFIEKKRIQIDLGNGKSGEAVEMSKTIIDYTLTKKHLSK